MKQVIAIHGGTTFAQYDEYLEYLRTKDVSVDRLLHQPMWKERLQEVLGDEYQVLLPSMPDKTNAKYSEWKLWFDRIAEVAVGDCILIGHSLGGIFLAKYLSENEFPRRIKATILIAAPFEDETTEDLTDFKMTEPSDLFRAQAGKAIVIYGADDPVVPASEAEKYRQHLPGAEFIQLPAPDHFVRPDFPELTETIQNVV